MGIIRPQKVKVKWNKKIKKYYESLGYKYTRLGDEFYVKIEDLTKGSPIKIKGFCDECGCELSWTWSSYNKIVKEDGKTYCKKCSMILFGGEKIKKSKLANSKSIAKWLVEEYGDNALELYWDYNKNIVDPWEINYKSNTKIWIYCQEKDYHGSYEIACEKLVKGNRCSFCGSHKTHPLDSLKQDIINNYGEEFFNIIWSDKNTIDPKTIKPKSEKVCWWNCPDGKHEPYKRSCNNSKVCGYRCPECVKEREESIIEEKTRIYLETLGYGVKTEWECSLIPINPKTGRPLPFDNEIVLENGQHLIIEVHGSQHYGTHFFMTTHKITKEEAEKELHYQQVKDRYKRIKCIQEGYEYLELPYWTFNDSNKYKKLIDDKIKEIVDK